jgi:hypothetical protein
MGASGVAGGVLMAIDPKLDCYAILGVPPDAEDGVIRAAFEALVERYHPDRFNGPRAEADQKMSDLNSAYEVLADPAQRRRYDLRRRIYARTAPLDAKDSKESVLGPRPAFPRMRAVSPAADPVPAPVRPRRFRVPRQYRVALWALMAAMVVLTASSLFRYSGLRSSPSSALPVAAEVRPGEIKPIPSRQAEIVPSQGRAASVPAQGRAAFVPEAVTSKIVAAPPAAVHQEAPSQDAKLAAPKSAPSRIAPSGHPANASPTPASERCTDIATVLGLCKPNSTAKDK